MMIIHTLLCILINKIDFLYYITMSQSLTFTVRSHQGVYVGEVVNGKANGMGQFTSELYELSGTFIDNKLVDGQFTHKNYCTYTGSLVNNHANGYGKCVHINGDTYEGEWQNGCRHGCGKLTYRDGSIYEGEWQDNRKHNHGVMKFANGIKLDGQWYGNKFVSGVMCIKHDDYTYTIMHIDE